MTKALDFNTLKKKVLTITLADEAKTKLLLTTPSKKVIDDLLRVQDSLSGEVDDGVINDLYELVTNLFNHNKTGKHVERETVEELMDLEDIIVFIGAYTDFLAEVTNSKN